MAQSIGNAFTLQLSRLAWKVEDPDLNLAMNQELVAGQRVGIYIVGNDPGCTKEIKACPKRK
jgi:hypothetical protein